MVINFKKGGCDDLSEIITTELIFRGSEKSRLTLVDISGNPEKKNPKPSNYKFWRKVQLRTSLRSFVHHNSTLFC
jgi:hypothetical protein